jgi:L-threonylcarbamoyladenylate synthase
VYLDGGPTVDAVPSTIVDLTGPAPQLLREGGLSFEELLKVVPNLIR